MADPVGCAKTAAAGKICFAQVEDMLSRNAENKNAKSKQFAVGFSRFLEVRIMIFCDVGGPRAHFGGLGPHLEDFLDFCDFGGRSGDERSSPFWAPILPKLELSSS